MATLAVSLRVDDHDRLLHVVYTGTFSLSEAETTFQEILAALIEHKVKRVLVDGRQVSGDPEPLERFYYGRYVADAVAQTINRTQIEVPRFAYVLLEPVLDPNRFGETVAVNRGMRVKVFGDMRQAEWWLGVTARE
jgi:dTDP-glucose pyrophosphorylase